MSKCSVLNTLDCGRLIITVIVYLMVFFLWITVVILELIHANIPAACVRGAFIRYQNHRPSGLHEDS